MGRVEALILQQGRRGMDLLAAHLPKDFCQAAALEIMSWERGSVLLTTGFKVAGHAETDGPPGTLLLIRSLEQLGFRPIVITDEICRGYFEHEGIETIYLTADADDLQCQSILDAYAPVGLISVERCGRNTLGLYQNMRGVTIEGTAPTDRLFELAEVPVIGIGDGGNEVGMGKLADVISRELTIVPCRVSTDHLIVATVSNWGALGLAACLGHLPDDAAYQHAYQLAYEFGYVDGITAENVLSEDGFPLEVGLNLLRDLREAVKA